MTTHVTTTLRRQVIHRAENRCEYCQLSQEGQEATFHIDHITPRTADGTTTEDNLALACVGCSLRKGARQHALDPQTGTRAPLFHPRTDSWQHHFHWRGVVLEGATPTGRATITALALNRPLLLAIREEESKLGRHPR